MRVRSTGQIGLKISKFKAAIFLGVAVLSFSPSALATSRFCSIFFEPTNAATTLTAASTLIRNYKDYRENHLLKRIEKFGYDHSTYLDRRDYLFKHPGEYMAHDSLEEKLAYFSSETARFDPNHESFFDSILNGDDWDRKYRLLKIMDSSNAYNRMSPYSMKSLMSELELLRSGNQMSVFDLLPSRKVVRNKKAIETVTTNILQTVTARGMQKNLELLGIWDKNRWYENVKTVFRDPRTRFAFELAMNAFSISTSLFLHKPLMVAGKLPPFKFHKLSEKTLEDLLLSPLTPERLDELVKLHLNGWKKQQAYDAASTFVGVASGALILGITWHEYSSKIKDQEEKSREMTATIVKQLNKETALQLEEIKKEQNTSLGDELFENWLADYKAEHPGVEIDTTAAEVRSARKHYSEMNKLRD